MAVAVTRGHRYAEHRLLARAAGLTEPDDGEQDTAAIGAAFLALQRTRYERAGR